jgi:hypothetical protein
MKNRLLRTSVLFLGLILSLMMGDKLNLWPFGEQLTTSRGAVSAFSDPVPQAYSSQKAGKVPGTIPAPPQGNATVSAANSSSTESLSFDVVMKANPVDQTKTDIYIKNQKTKEEKLFITLPDVCRMSGPHEQYHHGFLYIIRTTGKIVRSAKGDCLGGGPDFRRELWKYGPDEQGTLIYPGTVMAYMFSNDEKVLAIDTNDDVRFLADDRKVLRTLTPTDLGLDSPSLYAWGSSAFWLAEGLGAGFPNLVKVEVPSFEVTKFDLTPLGIGPEVDFDPATRRIVFSEFPPLYESVSANQFHASKKTVTLFVYDLETKRKQVVATSIAREFNPKWVADETVEYDNPNGKGRMTRRVP